MDRVWTNSVGGSWLTPAAKSATQPSAGPKGEARKGGMLSSLKANLKEKTALVLRRGARVGQEELKKEPIC